MVEQETGRKVIAFVSDDHLDRTSRRKCSFSTRAGIATRATLTRARGSPHCKPQVGLEPTTPTLRVDQEA
jgi:hypothetical protein